MEDGINITVYSSDIKVISAVGISEVILNERYNIELTRTNIVLKPKKQHPHHSVYTMSIKDFLDYEYGPKLSFNGVILYFTNFRSMNIETVNFLESISLADAIKVFSTTQLIGENLRISGIIAESTFLKCNKKKIQLRPSWLQRNFRLYKDKFVYMENNIIKGSVLLDDVEKVETETSGRINIKTKRKNRMISLKISNISQQHFIDKLFNVLKKDEAKLETSRTSDYIDHLEAPISAILKSEFYRNMETILCQAIIEKKTKIGYQLRYLVYTNKNYIYYYNYKNHEFKGKINLKACLKLEFLDKQAIFIVYTKYKKYLFQFKHNVRNVLKEFNFFKYEISKRNYFVLKMRNNFETFNKEFSKTLDKSDLNSLNYKNEYIYNSPVVKLGHSDTESLISKWQYRILVLEKNGNFKYFVPENLNKEKGTIKQEEIDKIYFDYNKKEIIIHKQKRGFKFHVFNRSTYINWYFILSQLYRGKLQKDGINSIDLGKYKNVGNVLANCLCYVSYDNENWESKILTINGDGNILIIKDQFVNSYFVKRYNSKFEKHTTNESLNILSSKENYTGNDIERELSLRGSVIEYRKLYFDLGFDVFIKTGVEGEDLYVKFPLYDNFKKFKYAISLNFSSFDNNSFTIDVIQKYKRVGFVEDIEMADIFITLRTICGHLLVILSQSLLVLKLKKNGEIEFLFLVKFNSINEIGYVIIDNTIKAEISIRNIPNFFSIYISTEKSYNFYLILCYMHYRNKHFNLINQLTVNSASSTSTDVSVTTPLTILKGFPLDMLSKFTLNKKDFAKKLENINFDRIFGMDSLNIVELQLLVSSINNVYTEPFFISKEELTGYLSKLAELFFCAIQNSIFDSVKKVERHKTEKKFVDLSQSEEEGDNNENDEFDKKQLEYLKSEVIDEDFNLIDIQRVFAGIVKLISLITYEENTINKSDMVQISYQEIKININAFIRILIANFSNKIKEMTESFEEVTIKVNKMVTSYVQFKRIFYEFFITKISSNKEIDYDYVEDETVLILVGYIKKYVKFVNNSVVEDINKKFIFSLNFVREHITKPNNIGYLDSLIETLTKNSLGYFRNSYKLVDKILSNDYLDNKEEFGSIHLIFNFISNNYNYLVAIIKSRNDLNELYKICYKFLATYYSGLFKYMSKTMDGFKRQSDINKKPNNNKKMVCYLKSMFMFNRGLNNFIDSLSLNNSNSNEDELERILKKISIFKNSIHEFVDKINYRIANKIWSNLFQLVLGNINSCVVHASSIMEGVEISHVVKRKNSSELPPPISLETKNEPVSEIVIDKKLIIKSKEDGNFFGVDIDLSEITSLFESMNGMTTLNHFNLSSLVAKSFINYCLRILLSFLENTHKTNYKQIFCVLLKIENELFKSTYYLIDEEKAMEIRITSKLFNCYLAIKDMLVMEREDLEKLDVDKFLENFTEKEKKVCVKIYKCILL